MNRSKAVILWLIILFCIPVFSQSLFPPGRDQSDIIYSKGNDHHADSRDHFMAFACKDRVTLQWPNDSSNRNYGFKIYRSEGDAENFVLISSYESNPNLNREFALIRNNKFYFTDLVVSPGISYWYKIICVEPENNAAIEYGPISASLPVQSYSEKTITVSPPRFRFEPLQSNSRLPIIKLQLDLPNNYAIAKSSNISIYKPQGERVKTIYSGPMEAGSYQLVWKRDIETGDIAKEGVFIAVFENDLIREATKLVLVK